MNVRNLIELDKGLKIFDSKYRILICYLLYGNEGMNFNSIIKEIKVGSSKLAHHLNQLVNLGFVRKEKLEDGVRGESSYKLTALGKDLIEKLMSLALQEKPKILAPEMHDLTWGDRMRRYRVFNDPVRDAFLKKSYKIWVSTPQMSDLLELLEGVFSVRGKRLYIKGASFTGKSSTIYDFLKSKDALGNERNGYGYKNGVLNFLSPIEPDLFSLYYVILDKLMGEKESILDRKWTLEELKSEVYKRSTNLRLIIMDDINFLAISTKIEIQKIIQEVLEIADHFNTSIVLIDLDEKNYQSPFPDMLPDFDTFVLKRLNKAETTAILLQFEREYDMPLMSDLENVIESIYKASEGRVGCIDRILRDTGAYALLYGISVLSDDLIHKHFFSWYHRRDKEDCSLCGFKSYSKSL